jgi:o-succinylbenzoate synthase
MRIATASVRPVRLRFARPVRTARGEFLERESVLFELRDTDGFVGVGEAAPWPGFGTETAGEALAVLRAVASRLADAEVDLHDAADDRTKLPGHAPAARAALQGALWDLAARRAGRPLAAELAARVRVPAQAPLRQVEVSALLAALEPEAVRDEARRAREAGHRAVKLKLGSLPLALDVARVRAAREGIGARVALRGDANGAWTLREAQAALEALAQFDLEYLEQPVAADDLAGLAALRGRSALRIAADESVATETDAMRVVEAGAVDAVVLKPAMLGGPARALGIAARAHRAGMSVVFTHAFETSVGAHHALHCAAAWGDATAVHGLVTAGLFDGDVAAPVASLRGRVELGAAPGIGITP